VTVCYIRCAHKDTIIMRLGTDYGYEMLTVSCTTVVRCSQSYKSERLGGLCRVVVLICGVLDIPHWDTVVSLEVISVRISASAVTTWVGTRLELSSRMGSLPGMDSMVVQHHHLRQSFSLRRTWRARAGRGGTQAVSEWSLVHGEVKFEFKF